MEKNILICKDTFNRYKNFTFNSIKFIKDYKYNCIKIYNFEKSNGWYVSYKKPENNKYYKSYMVNNISFTEYEIKKYFYTPLEYRKAKIEKLNEL